MASTSEVNGSSSASTVTVPDSIFDRSRMSLIKLSRSVPAAWIVRAKSTCLDVRLPSGFSVQLLAEDEDAVERSAQLVRHVRQEFRLVLGRQCKLRRLFLERSASLLDFLVFALHFDIALGQLLGFLLQLLVGLLQLGLLRLQFGCQLLRLLEQPFRLHGGLDAVQHDADAGRQLLEEGDLQGREVADRGKLDHRLHLVLEQHRKHDAVARPALNSAEPIGTAFGGNVRYAAFVRLSAAHCPIRPSPSLILPGWPCAPSSA